MAWISAGRCGVDMVLDSLAFNGLDTTRQIDGGKLRKLKKGLDTRVCLFRDAGLSSRRPLTFAALLDGASHGKASRVRPFAASVSMEHRRTMAPRAHDVTTQTETSSKLLMQSRT